ncbi:hypothetical protein ACJX0J_012878, partial [Zea mays]
CQFSMDIYNWKGEYMRPILNKILLSHCHNIFLLPQFMHNASTINIFGFSNWFLSLLWHPIFSFYLIIKPSVTH